VPVFAFDLNDRALSLCSEGRVLACAPAVVTVGEPKSISSRHWWELGRQRSPSARTLALIAADLSSRLREHPPSEGARIWMAAPAMLEPQRLGTILGMARTLSWPLDGFVDAAVASATALGLDRPALALDLGLHHVAVTSLECAGQIRRRRVASSDRGGLLDLYQQWLALLGAIFVKRTRFDPLHDAATERQLFDLLPQLARDVAVAGSATAVLDARDTRLEVPISADQLSQAAHPLYREVRALLHALRPAGAPIALLAPQALIELPGLRAVLSEFSGCELITLKDGFAGCALSLLDLPPRDPASDAVPFLRRLPAQRSELGALPTERELLERDARQTHPTHVLLAGRTFVLGRNALVVGRALQDPDSISLPEGLAGVSRRHCTFVREGDATVLIDHSRCGTFVNEERVAERIRVHAGDRVRLGEPGVELALIAVDATTGHRYAPPTH
jgi:hypothetical protein